VNAPKIAACLIVKDAADTIEQCLESIRPFVDGIFVYDTGSTDATVEKLLALNEFDRFLIVDAAGQVVRTADRDAVAEEGQQLVPIAPITVKQGEWRDDFSWAREQSFAMPDESFDWIIWLDDDDVIRGAEHLRMFAHSANDNCNGFIFQYDYARDEHGNCLCVLWRERLIRRSANMRWEGPVHEVLIPPDGVDPGFVMVPPNLVTYVHNRPADRYSPERNLDILRAQEQQAEETGEPVQPRILAYLGTELMARGRFDEAAVYLQRYVERPDAMWSDERMQVAHKLAICARALGNPQASVEIEMQALRVRDDWAETYVGLAESFAQLEQWDRVERWAKRAIELGAPQTPLIVNPLEFSLMPMLRISEVCARSGRWDESEQWLSRAAQSAPGQQIVQDRAAALQQMRLEGETVETVLKLREILVRFDENQKAYMLLEHAVPYLVSEHPAFIKARADQREMVKHFTHPDEYKRWYEDEPKESSLTDEHIDLVGEWFGRVGALHAGLIDQEEQLGRKPLLLDMGCNDWWMGEFFARQGIRCDGVELNRRSYDLALERIARFDRDVTVVQGDLHNARDLLARAVTPGTQCPQCDEESTLFEYEPGWWECTGKGHRLDSRWHAPQYDAISLFEVFEHVPDIEATLDVMESLLAPGGRIYISTPNGAFERGQIANWAEVVRKGHLRAIPLHELAQIILRRGEIEQLEETNGDRVGFVSYTPKAKKGTVTFYAGQSWEPWSATSLKDGGIGGSETALVQVATRLAGEGWLVKVYSGAEAGLLGGVLYRPTSAFDPTETVDLLVVSRMPHIFDNPIGARQTALWCHDHSYDNLTPARAEKIDHIVVLSEWQRDRFARLYPFAEDRLTIIRNGISLRDWFGADNYPMAKRSFKKRKSRLIYSSSADRGLDVLLDLWPRIREKVPAAELHAFYGFETLDRVAQINPGLAAYKGALLAKVQELGGEEGGVFLRGRVGQSVLADEMQQARVLAYPTAFLETSCITAMEARAAGLAIVTSDLGALSETVGEHGVLLPWADDETETHNRSDDYQDAFVDAVVDRLTQANLWEIWHRAALENRDELDWSERIPQWAALTLPAFAKGGYVSGSVLA
jgi:glycosyltransferase involved in cell wall biosynthesis/uncharacterized protein (UPF0297 family)